MTGKLTSLPSLNVNKTNSQRVCSHVKTSDCKMGVNITTIAYLRVLIIEIGSTIILMVVEAQGDCKMRQQKWRNFTSSNLWCSMHVHL